MTITRTQAQIARRLAHEVPDIDQGLPMWARRTNPIVRRQLGMYWRVFPPQAEPIAKWVGILSLVVLATIPYPLLFVIILTFLLAALAMLPYAFVVYGKALLQIVGDAVISIVDEYKNETLTLLRTTPLSTTEIVLSKIAASVWRRMDELDQVLSFGLALGMPAIMMFYLGTWPPNEVPYVAQIMTIMTFASSLLRLPLEMFMVASLGMMLGAGTHVRSSAFLATAVVVFFYFLLINLARLLDLNWPLQLFVDAVLPIILPIVITWFSVRMTMYLVLRD